MRTTLKAVESGWKLAGKLTGNWRIVSTYSFPTVYNWLCSRFPLLLECGRKCFLILISKTQLAMHLCVDTCFYCILPINTPTSARQHKTTNYSGQLIEWFYFPMVCTYISRPKKTLHLARRWHLEIKYLRVYSTLIYFAGLLLCSL